MIQRLVLLGALGLVPILAACAPAPATPPPVAEATERLASKATETPVAVAASPTAMSSAPTAAVQTEEPAVAPTDDEVPPTVDPAAEVDAAFPTPHPNPECVAAPIPEDPNIAAVTADEWSKGRDDAPITLVEYSDFQ